MHDTTAPTLYEQCILMTDHHYQLACNEKSSALLLFKADNVHSAL